jgi:hypothetical protein
VDLATRVAAGAAAQELEMTWTRSMTGMARCGSRRGTAAMSRAMTWARGWRIAAWVWMPWRGTRVRRQRRVTAFFRDTHGSMVLDSCELSVHNGGHHCGGHRHCQFVRGLVFAGVLFDEMLHCTSIVRVLLFVCELIHPISSH